MRGKGTAPLLERLPPQKRGELLRLSVQDHYTEIVTTRGRNWFCYGFPMR